MNISATNQNTHDKDKTMAALQWLQDNWAMLVQGIGLLVGAATVFTGMSNKEGAEGVRAWLLKISGWLAAVTAKDEPATLSIPFSNKVIK